MLLAACAGSGGSGSGGGTDSATGSTGGAAATSATGGASTSGATTSTTAPQPDYWNSGLCNGVTSPSADDCMSVTNEGECDAEGQVIYCNEGVLYCIDCPANGYTCEYEDANGWYDCVPPGGGTSTGPTTGGTGTSTSTSG